MEELEVTVKAKEAADRGTWGSSRKEATYGSYPSGTRNVLGSKGGS